MQQYIEIKNQHKDEILFYRIGDFYEMFFDDALTVSKELDLTLTGKQCGLEERAPMCGVPYHSCDGYIARLIAKGYKVAICEQTEDPAAAKGLVKRDIIRVVTPGTVIDESCLSAERSNYLCGVYLDDTGAGLCACDISTGKAQATVFTGPDRVRALLKAAPDLTGPFFLPHGEAVRRPVHPGGRGEKGPRPVRSGRAGAPAPGQYDAPAGAGRSAGVSL